MRLVDYLDKGTSLGPDAPCLTTDGETRSYAEVQAPRGWWLRPWRDTGSRRGSRSQSSRPTTRHRSHACSGSPAPARWCPINPRNEAAENRELLDLFDCTALLFQAAFAPLVEAIARDLPKLKRWSASTARCRER